MCAIFGIIGKSDRKLIEKISKIQIYRGPDKQDFFETNDKTALIGNNRLAVIDKEKGKQPMKSNDGRFVIVFNGCIYNFLEIKKYLIQKKIFFRTNSDTEVAVNSFMYFGEKAFNYFDGMWAMSIYDLKENTCYLSRDYVGQKPLYYSLQKDYLLFSSQLKGIFQDKNINKIISKNNLKKYFAYSYVPAPETIYENICQVQAGETIKINSKNLKIIKKKYWDIIDGPDYNEFFIKEDKKNFVNDFNVLIKQFCIADQKPIISLSGGIDSNIILNSILANNKRPKTFTLGFNNITFDESRDVESINSHFDKNIYKVNETEITDKFLHISKYISEPNGDSSFLPTYILFNKIKDYTNVSLGGDGGDESFFGYITYDAFVLAKILKFFIPNKLLKLIKKSVSIKSDSYDYLSTKKKINKFLSSIDLNQKYLLSSWMSCLNLDDHSKYFNENILPHDIFKDSYNVYSNNKTSLRNAQFYYFKYYLPMVLSKVDQASMLNSVENRSPFISKKIINLSLDTNINELYSIFNKKKFLKDKYKSIIHKKILKRPKHGFAFQTDIILRNKDLINKLIKPNIIYNYDFFNEKYSTYLNNDKDYSQYLWNELILNLSIQNLNS